jgi:hypothetical protein
MIQTIGSRGESQPYDPKSNLSPSSMSHDHHTDHDHRGLPVIWTTRLTSDLIWTTRWKSNQLQSDVMSIPTSTIQTAHPHWTLRWAGWISTIDLTWLHPAVRETKNSTRYLLHYSQCISISTTKDNGIHGRHYLPVVPAVNTIIYLISHPLVFYNYHLHPHLTESCPPQLEPVIALVFYTAPMSNIFLL